MYQRIIQFLPTFIFYLFLTIFLYGITIISFTGDYNLAFDWAQIHTAFFTILVSLIALLLSFLTVWILVKKELITQVANSRVYHLISAFLFATFIGLVGALLFLIYHIDLHQLGKSIEWIQEYTDRYLLSSFILGLLAFGVILLTGEVYIGSGISILLFFILALTNHYKKIFRNEPLFPNDFIQVTQLKEVIPMIRESISLSTTILVVISVIALFVLWLRSPKLKIDWRIRIILILPIMFISKSFLFFEDTFAEKYYEKYSAIMPWNQQNNYYYNGPVIGMISNIKTNILEEPEGYSEKRVTAAVENMKKEVKPFSSDSKADKKPNIVFVMNESFWDPTKLDLSFSKDPLEHTKELMKKYPSGSMLSPAFGGETANVEFEALTSYSMNTFNPGGLPFQHILSKKEYPSFASYLNQLGYYTEAMHPNNGIMYMRQNVYPNLGFEKSLFIDEMDFTEKDNEGFVSDDSVVNQVLDTLKKSDKPAFIHAVTIGNHLPYPTTKYNGEKTISVEGDNLSPEMKSEIEIYAEGIKQSDDALKKLETEIQKLDEPTLVVFWGDHLPALGKNLQGYIEGGFGNTGEFQKSKEFYETPLLFMANFNLNMEQELGTISPMYFAPMIVDELNYKPTLFYSYLSKMKEHIPAFRKQIYLNDEGEVVHDTSSLKRDAIQYMKQYQLLEFDTLSGKQYGKESLYK
ncbi:sulfatase-like hydrolase/transferase [Priestia flexa]|uniref:alkaline phosphatase family protein n=1 Tax=Priestia flexa TaxID=86664 RepID=UPI002E22B46B|nr:sulfatase-like hydrolase/transferase [Priestia flexa]MED3823777.1 sulfatase-like hydrolase/transferase [Priestia flexa]